MKADSIKSELESYASTVNNFILAFIEGKPKELYQASSHYIRTGGKRLRPFMVLKCCEMLGGCAERALPAAAAVELVHNFTLVHDDIMDNDEMRHGTATVHRYYGMPLAILSGDILFSKAFELLTVNCRKAGISDKSIIDMVGKKTATLFEVSCALGVLSSPNHTTVDIRNLSSFGRNIGIAFQLVDDLIGVIGDPKLTGKAAGNDIREGKDISNIACAEKHQQR